MPTRILRGCARLNNVIALPPTVSYTKTRNDPPHRSRMPHLWSTRFRYLNWCSRRMEKIVVLLSVEYERATFAFCHEQYLIPFSLLFAYFSCFYFSRLRGVSQSMTGPYQRYSSHLSEFEVRLRILGVVPTYYEWRTSHLRPSLVGLTLNSARRRLARRRAGSSLSLLRVQTDPLYLLGLSFILLTCTLWGLNSFVVQAGYREDRRAPECEIQPYYHFPPTMSSARSAPSCFFHFLVHN